MIVTGAFAAMVVEVGAAASGAIGSTAGSFASASLREMLAIGFAVNRAADVVDAAVRLFSGFGAGAFFDGAIAALDATDVAVAVGGVAGRAVATTSVVGVGDGGVLAAPSAVPGARGRRGNASAATTPTEAAIKANGRRRLVRFAGAGLGGAATAAASGATTAAGRTAGVEDCAAGGAGATSIAGVMSMAGAVSIAGVGSTTRAVSGVGIA